MAILNYTTGVKADKSIGEIHKKLVAFGAQSIMVEYEDGLPSSMSFNLSVVHGEGAAFSVGYRLPANIEGVHAALKKAKVENRYASFDHARKVGWRILKDWVEAQLAFLEAGLAPPSQILLPFAITPDGRTLYEHFAEDPRKLLSN